MIVHKKLFTRVNYFHLEAADGFYPMQTRTSQKSSFLDTVRLYRVLYCVNRSGDESPLRPTARAAGVAQAGQDRGLAS